MAWIKRNLYFLLISLVALALMGMGGYLLWEQMAKESQASAEIEKLYAELDEMNKKADQPGPQGGTNDNVKLARDQQEKLRAEIGQIAVYFERIPAIPENTNRLSNEIIATQLRNTILQLQRAAEQQSVTLPNNYFFTFEAQQKHLTFDPASLTGIASHLGEIKAICNILFAAKINSLESIRREIITTLDDTNITDYLPPDQKTVTNDLALLTPYQITFESFSAELSTVLGQFASSPNGFIVKEISVEPAASSGGPGMMPGAGYPGSPYPTGYPAPGTSMPMMSPDMNGMANGGMQPAQGYGGRPGMARGMGAPPPGTPPPGRGGPGVYLNEKPLRVTLLIQVVKLKPRK